MSDKIGRNDPCPCGSGLKYKKCCMKNDKESKHKQQQEMMPDYDKESKHKQQQEMMPDYDRNIYSSTFATKQEIMDSIRDDGFIPVVVDEGIYDGIHGKMIYVEIDEICKHGVSEECQKFELKEGKWKYVESRCNMCYCSICNDLKEGKVVYCSNCGEKVPDLTDEDRLRMYEDEMFSSMILTPICPSCGSPWVYISK